MYREALEIDSEINASASITTHGGSKVTEGLYFVYFSLLILFLSTLWCGVMCVMWCGVVRCCVVWCGVMWCGVVWYGVMCCAMVCVLWCGV